MVLITGATGFLGSHLLCLLLKKGEIVRAIRRENSSMEQLEYVANYYFPQDSRTALSRIKWFYTDLFDIQELEKSMQGVATIYHCAGAISFSRKDRPNLFKTNVEGTANLVNLALDVGVINFCHVSSTAALGRSLSKKIINEETEWIDHEQNSNYAISKYLGEMEVWRGQEEGLNITIVNPGVILGKTNVFSGSMSIIQQVKKGFPFYTKGINGFVDVEDVANIMVQLIQEKKYGNRYVCISENISYQALLTMAAKSFKQKDPRIETKPWMTSIAWKVIGLGSFFIGKKPFLTKETASTSHSINKYDNSKVKKALNFEFCTVQDTIKKMVDSD